MRLIDADALKEKMKCTNRYFNIKFDIDEAPTIDPETLPIVQTLKRQVQEAESEAQYCRNNWKKAECKLAQVITERDAIKSNPPAEIKSDAFEIAARLAQVTAERDELKKNVRPVVRGIPVLKYRPQRYEHYEEVGLNDKGEMLYLKRVYVDEKNYAMYCPVCGKRLCSRFTNFCPNCGANMRGEAR